MAENSFNESQLIAEVAFKTQLPEEQCKAFIDAMKESVIDAIFEGKSVVLTNLGSWYVKEWNKKLPPSFVGKRTKARRYVLRFNPAVGLKARLNDG